MLNETRAQIRFRICDCEPELPAAVADSLGSALIVCVQLAPVGLPRLLSIPDSWVMACRSCKSVKHCDLADGGDGRGASARSLLTSSVHSVFEVLRTRKTDGLKESDSRLGSAGVRLGKNVRPRANGWLGGPFAASFAWPQVCGEHRLGTFSSSVPRCARLHL